MNNEGIMRLMTDRVKILRALEQRKEELEKLKSNIRTLERNLEGVERDLDELGAP